MLGTLSADLRIPTVPSMAGLIVCSSSRLSVYDILQSVGAIDEYARIREMCNVEYLVWH